MMIEVANLTKSFRRGTLETEVLKGVTFSIPHGEFIAIMGPSGSGKSTLLNILGLLDRPDGGTYLLDGTDYSGATDEVRSAARNRKIGFVFQQSTCLIARRRSVTSRFHCSTPKTAGVTGSQRRSGRSMPWACRIAGTIFRANCREANNSASPSRAP